MKPPHLKETGKVNHQLEKSTSNITILEPREANITHL